jgi:aminotransferase
LRFADRMAGLEHSSIRNWSRLIAERGGINLAQGICAVEPRSESLQSNEHACLAMREGQNTYSHYSGIDELRAAIAVKAFRYNGITANPDPIEGNILVTAGATGAFVGVFNAIVNPGDEVIFFEPFYRYNVNLLALCGGVPRFVQLRSPDWSFDPAELEAAFSRRTRAIVVNNPCNPCGKVFTRDELSSVAAFCQRRDVLAITDEVYEYILYDGTQHTSLATLPGMAERTVTITSFSKTLAITGWRIGYSISPPEIAKQLGLVNDFNYACAPVPLQHGIVEAVRNCDGLHALKDVYAAKRAFLVTALEEVGFRVHVPRGAYYILADHTDFGFGDDFEAVTELVTRIGVGAVPGSEFFSGGRGKELLRFCFAFRDEGLIQARERLRKLSKARS